MIKYVILAAGFLIVLFEKLFRIEKSENAGYKSTVLPVNLPT
jgi:hypothetical protein